MRKSGFAFHYHHDVLAEWCFDYDERVRAIKIHKPKEEQELRLSLFKMIPKDRLPQELNKTRQAYDEAGQAHIKARQAYTKAGQAYDEARQACDEAWQALDIVLQAHMPQIAELHKELCPDCPWDNDKQTIFPKRRMEK